MIDVADALTLFLRQLAQHSFQYRFARRQRVPCQVLIIAKKNVEDVVDEARGGLSR
jgi:hypothetical protein